MTGKRSKIGYQSILERLSNDFESLVEELDRSSRSDRAHRAIRDSIGGLAERMGQLAVDIDPVRHPQAVFDLGDPKIVGRFVALGLVAQPKLSLAEVDRFFGSGVYSLYYRGNFHAYAPISGSESPIYVGKADPQSDDARTPQEQGERLVGRLKDHRKNIGLASSTLRAEDFSYRALVVQSGWQNAAEDYLISFFEPVWNNESKVCYGLGKHGDSSKTRANSRSPWDTLHPGRKWALDSEIDDARPMKNILSDINNHFANRKPYLKFDDVLEAFLVELRQF